MKKLYTLFTAMIIGLGTMMMTSCDEDQMIGMNLEGTWVGNMYIVREWSGHSYKATESEITFTSDPFRNTKGSGYWIDYYSDCSWDYVANHIRWDVSGRTLHVYFVEDRYDIYITDFRVNNHRFQGWIDSDNGESLKFDLVKVYDDSRNWGDYNWGYYDYYDYYGYSRSAATSEFNMIEDSQKQNMGSNTSEKPIIHIAK